MHLKKTKNPRGRIFLSICHSYRQEGRNKSKTVKSLGYLDALEKDYDDPIAHFTEVAHQMDERYKQAHATISLDFSPDKKVDKRVVSRKNAGYAVYSKEYHALDIDKFWRNRADKRPFKYDANAIFRLLVFNRLLCPGSKKAAFDSKDTFFDRCAFTLDDIYHALSFFCEYESDFKATLDASVARLRPRNTTHVFYDVTNYYFEVEEEDDLRRRGVSKEHRPNPIVQMGLLMDGDGIPIDYEIFAGNTGDMLTLMPVMKGIRARHAGERMIVVADKGLNTSNNIASTILDGNGYVFSQSVRRATSELKDWVLDDTGYSHDSENFKIKSRQSFKNVYVESDEGKKKTVRVPVKEVAFWSRDYAVRSQAERSKVIEKTTAALERGDMSSALSKTHIRYAKESLYVAETGEKATKSYDLDQHKIERDEALDGYYCIVTSEVDLTDTEVIDIYRGLWRIEETFKVTKSTLETRPVYVSREDHIRAHFMICYAALLIMRLIQADTNWKYSAQTIMNELGHLQCSNIKDNYWFFDYRSDITDELCQRAGIELNREIRTLKEIKDILSATRK